MLKLKTAICTALLGALAFAPGVQAGGFTNYFSCDELEASSKDTGTFCDGGRNYSVTLNCMNLTPPVDGTLNINRYADGPGLPVGFWTFLVRQDTEFNEDIVCEASGWYGDSFKTEMKCTDAPTGSNKCKPGNGNSVGCDFDQADFEIKDIGACP